jgi:hypothetical protein
MPSSAMLMFSSGSDSSTTNLLSKSKLYYDRRSASQSVPDTHLGPMTRSPLWREDGSVVYNCCWSLTEQSFPGPSPSGLMTIFYCLIWHSPTWRVSSLCLYPPETRWSSGTGFPLHHLVQLAGLRWRYSNCLHTVTNSLLQLYCLSGQGPCRKHCSSVAVASIGMPTWSIVNRYLETVVVYRTIA